jgi:hypothetical protein
MENALEEWREFPDNINYEVSNLGRIRNLYSKNILKGSKTKTGYIITILQRKRVSFHYAVAKTFIINPENKRTVNHKNSVKTDNRVENLEWATHLEQNIHMIENNDLKYNDHNNGRIILRLDPNTKKIVEAYPSLICASKWILEHQNTTCKEFTHKNIRTFSYNFSSQMRKSTDDLFFNHDFYWKFKEIEENLLNEIWKPITTIKKNGYFISNLGRIKTPKNIIKATFNKANGYYTFKANNIAQMIHRLVAINFIDNPLEKPFVNHIDGDCLNNNVDNLEWCTNAENTQHAYDTYLNPTTAIIQYDKEGIVKVAEFKSIVEASKKLNILSSNIQNVCNGNRLQTHGFHFKYKTDEGKEMREKHQRVNSIIIQYDISGNTKIAEFKSVTEASNKLNIDRHSISDVCKEKKFQIKGFHFKYKQI